MSGNFRDASRPEAAIDDHDVVHAHKLCDDDGHFQRLAVKDQVRKEQTVTADEELILQGLDTVEKNARSARPHPGRRGS